MKQVFGIFSAIILMPAFQVQAWIGGPFSNNSYQTNGDDGIYEAVGSMTDGTAMYRWAVHNENPGGVAIVGPNAGGETTSNVLFGGLVGAVSPHVIWYRGVVYYGRCFGIVNSGLNGTVLVTGNATNAGSVFDNTGNPVGANANGVLITPPLTTPATKSVANSTFRAKITQKYPMKRFHGRGQVHYFGAAGAPDGITNFLQHGHKVGMKVFGAQVSYQVNG